MIKFFRYYEDESDFTDALHKTQYTATALTPLLILLLGIFTYVSILLATAMIAALTILYLTGIYRSVLQLVRKKDAVKLSPLFVSSISGPIYLGALLLLDFSLVGATGLILCLGIPALMLIPVVIDSLRNPVIYENEDYELEEELSQDNENTEEIQAVS